MPYYDKDKNKEVEAPKTAQQCDSCGRIFFAEEGDIYCRNCEKKGNTDFQRARAFIQKNPGTDILTVSKATGISAGLIMRYVKEGKIDSR